MAANPQTLDAVVTERLRAIGQRATANRETLVRTLSAAGQPLTIREILRRRRGLAQSSVYRNLVVLEQASVVRRVVTTDEFARYELAEDLTDHHHHLVCVSCGSVEDVPASGVLERKMHEALVEIESTSSFVVQGHRLDVTGLCRRCG